MNKPYPIVFSDLDNCLLDRHNYGFAAATEALEALRRHGVPLILVSSKTRRADSSDAADSDAVSDMPSARPASRSVLLAPSVSGSISAPNPCASSVR